MRLYPELSPRRVRTIALDVAVVVAVLVFAWLGVKVHDAVMELTSVSDGVQSAGGAVQGAFETAGERVRGAPVVGGQVGDALRDAVRGTGGEAVAAGRTGEEGIGDLASLLGWLTFLLPSALLLSRVLPPRHTPDPLGDLAAGRLDALVAAVREDAGLR
jgi:hypothetical protein